MGQRFSFRWLWFWVPVVLAMLWLGRCAHGAEAQLVATPRAKAMNASATNRPFLAAARTEQPVLLQAAGYAETEYLVTGLANVYEWAGEGSAQMRILAKALPYATRMLVRRPVDPRKFSGMVVVELLDAGEQYDRAPLWGLSSKHFLRRGDAWVGITVRPAAVASLRRFDPVRYAALSFAYPQPAGCARQADLREYPPNTETGLAWDVIAQAGALLRSSSKENPLLDLNPRAVIAAGHGLGAAYVTTYANAVHGMLRRGDGTPIFDGFLAAEGAQQYVPINQCAAPLRAGDPRRAVMPRDVPFVAVMTETDFNRAPDTHRADSDAPGDIYRLFEIPGAAKLGGWEAGQPAAADLNIAGFTAPAADACREPTGDFPTGLAFNAIWQQYAELFTAGQPLATAMRIETLADGGARRDENGNASGGWRLPQLDAPLAVYSPRSTPRDAADRAAASCAATGSKQPLSAAKLKALYRDRAGYLKQFRAAVDRAVNERRLVREDGEALKTLQARALPQF
jgi:hypothetical protein